MVETLSGPSFLCRGLARAGLGKTDGSSGRSFLLLLEPRVSGAALSASRTDKGKTDFGRLRTTVLPDGDGEPPGPPERRREERRVAPPVTPLRPPAHRAGLGRKRPVEMGPSGSECVSLCVLRRVQVFFVKQIKIV